MFSAELNLFWTLTKGLQQARKDSNKRLADEHAGELADMALQCPSVTLRHRAQHFLTYNGYPHLYEQVREEYRVNEFMDTREVPIVYLPPQDNGGEAPCVS